MSAGRVRLALFQISGFNSLAPPRTVTLNELAAVWGSPELGTARTNHLANCAAGSSPTDITRETFFVAAEFFGHSDVKTSAFLCVAVRSPSLSHRFF